MDVVERSRDRVRIGRVGAIVRRPIGLHRRWVDIRPVLVEALVKRHIAPRGDRAQCQDGRRRQAPALRVADLVADACIDAKLELLVGTVGQVSRDGHIRADSPLMVVRVLVAVLHLAERVTRRIGRAEPCRGQNIQRRPVRIRRVVVRRRSGRRARELRIVVVRLVVRPLRVADVIVDRRAGQGVLAADLEHL